MSLSLNPSGSIRFYSVPASSSRNPSGSLATHFFGPEYETARIQTDYASGYPKGLQFLIRSESVGTVDSITALYITTSQQDLKIGFGTDEPVGALDVRAKSTSSPANLVLRTNEDGVVTPGEETGRISFVIESSSYEKTKLIASGSSAEIFSRVIQTGSSGGAYGSLIFSLNDNNGSTEPTEVFQLGYGLISPGGFGLILSSSDISQKDTSPEFVQKYSISDSNIVRLGYHNAINLDKGSLTLYDGGDTIIFMSALNGTISSSGAITGSDVYIDDWGSVSASLAAAGGGGGSTPTLQQVTNQGASTTTPITASIISASDTITSVSASIDHVLVNNKLQGNGSGFQFFAFNEDTIKVKFANWYSSNDRQYGMGQLWFETWFAAIDNQASRDNRRIGFYLEEPDAGSTDSGTPGQHPTNARFYVDITGSYVASGGLHVTDANFDVESNGNVSIGSGDLTVSGTLSATINGGTF